MGNSSWSNPIPKVDIEALRNGYVGKYDSFNGQMYAYEPHQKIAEGDLVINVISHDFIVVTAVYFSGSKFKGKIKNFSNTKEEDYLLKEVVKMVPLLTEKLIETNNQTGVFDA